MKKFFVLFAIGIASKGVLAHESDIEKIILKDGEKKIDSRCPLINDPLKTTLLPHESDCTKFYKCDWGEAVLKNCPAGLHFNAILSVCDWPASANCELGITPPPVDETSPVTEVPTAPPTEVPTAPPTGVPTAPPTEDSTPTPDSELDPRCPAINGEFVIFLPHETDCTKFYKCDWGRAILYVCPDGLHFNRELDVCDWPVSANCESGITPPPVEETSPPTEITTAPPTAVPTAPPTEVPTAPPTEVPTAPPTEVPTAPPTEVPTAPPTEVPTAPPTEVPTAPPTGVPTAPPTEYPTPTSVPELDPRCPTINGEFVTFLPHETDCTKFYKCDWGRAILYVCPDGLHFNRELDVCDWPASANCESRFTPPSVEETLPETAPPKEPEAEEEPAFISYADLDPRCPSKNEGFLTLLPHETDCTKFYKCDWGRAIVYSCPEGHHFNGDLNACEWVERANCTL